MSSTEYNIGLGEGKSSSRVLRPPGGGSSGLFEPAAEVRPHARPKYDQQNSSNLNFCMGTVDPNIKVRELAGEKIEAAQPEPASAAPASAAAPAESSIEASPAKQENLPQYHHHRSTALW